MGTTVRRAGRVEDSPAAAAAFPPRRYALRLSGTPPRGVRQSAAMPLAFPSHQGLILPVARRWPEYFDGLALCVGAATPDLVDGAAGLIGRGHLGQGLGHSLLGVGILCWPAGMLMTWVLAA